MLVIASGFQQLITMVQILSVLRRFEIDAQGQRARGDPVALRCGERVPIWVAFH